MLQLEVPNALVVAKDLSRGSMLVVKRAPPVRECQQLRLDAGAVVASTRCMQSCTCSVGGGGLPPYACSPHRAREGGLAAVPRITSEAEGAGSDALGTCELGILRFVLSQHLYLVTLDALSQEAHVQAR